MSMRKKGKTVSKETKKPKISFATRKTKKYREAFMVIDGREDKKIQARFTNEEIKAMRARAKKYDIEISKLDVGLPISVSEWDKIDERQNWDVYAYKTPKGKKVKLLATIKESDKGIMRADPNWRRKRKKPVERSGQTTLQL